MMVEDEFGGRRILRTVVWLNMIDSVGAPLWFGVTLATMVLQIYVIRNGSLEKYRDEILTPIVSLYVGAIGDDFILMDGNARPHRARIVNEYLQQESIERMDWPATSPDLNPIDHAWGHLATSDFKSTNPAKLPTRASRCTL